MGGRGIFCELQLGIPFFKKLMTLH